MTNAYKGSRNEILILQGATKTYRDAIKGLKEEDKGISRSCYCGDFNDFKTI